MRFSLWRAGTALATGLSTGLCLPLQGWAAIGTATNVTTYHYDNRRTGWNQSETTLTPASVAANFGLQAQVALDEQVDAQPLFVSGVQIAGGTHDVVYVATENNSIYAIDAATGAVLLQQNYGAAVPIAALPGGCNNNSNNMGINSTPVIDSASNTLYAITYTYENNNPVFRVHAINLQTLADRMAPVAVAASSTYGNGAPVSFNSANNRQRAGLLLSNGTLYAGFASWCDINANVSRGWVLGWNAATLTPLANAKLTDRHRRSGDDFFLSSIWMSGYGLASDDQNGIFFVTGNTDYNGRDYNSTLNISESVVNMSADLSTMQGFFTPTGGQGWSNWDKWDSDFGAGGVLLLPDQPGAYPHLAVAAGKSGPMVLLNRDALPGTGIARKVTLGTYANYGCWCGQSYYTGADGVGRVVESSGSNVLVWTVQTSPKTRLVNESVSPGLNSGQDPGFFTTVSSNGTQANTAVIWAISRPQGSDTTQTIYLQAFDPANGSAALLGSGIAAGTWPFGGNANANLVPVVANGRVFVASYANLSIFGPAPTTAAARHAFHPVAAPARPAFAGAPHDVYGTVETVTATSLTLRTRTGARLVADITPAVKAHDFAPAMPGQASLLRGRYDAAGHFVAAYVLHAKSDPAGWPADR